MKVNTVYTSDDGRDFDSREACLEWEKNAPLIELVENWCTTEDAVVLVKNLLASYVIAKKKKNG